MGWFVDSLKWIFGGGGGGGNKYAYEVELKLDVKYNQPSPDKLRAPSIDEDRGFAFATSNNNVDIGACSYFVINRAIVGFVELLVGGIMLGVAWKYIDHHENKWFPYKIFVVAYVMFFITRLTWVFYGGELNWKRQMPDIDPSDRTPSFSHAEGGTRYKASMDRLKGPCGRQAGYVGNTILEIIFLVLAWWFYGLSEIFHQKDGLTRTYSALTCWLLLICFMIFDPALNVKRAIFFQPQDPVYVNHRWERLRTAGSAAATVARAGAAGVRPVLNIGQDAANTAMDYPPPRIYANRDYWTVRFAVEDVCVDQGATPVEARAAARSVTDLYMILPLSHLRPAIEPNRAVPWPIACVNTCRCGK